MARELRRVERAGIRQADIDRVPLVRPALDAGGNVEDIARRLDQPFGQEKAGRELAIVPGRAHHHGHALAFHADLQRLLGGDFIRRVLPRAVIVAVELELAAAFAWARFELPQGPRGLGHFERRVTGIAIVNLLHLFDGIKVADNIRGAERLAGLDRRARRSPG